MVNRWICFHIPYAIFHRHGNMKMQKTVREWCSRIWCNFSIFVNFVHFKGGWVYKCSCSAALKSGTQLAESYSDLAPTFIFLFFSENNWAFKLLTGECYFSKFKKFLDCLENIMLVRKAKRKGALQNKFKVSQMFPVVHFAQSIIFEYNQGDIRDLKDLMKRNAGCCDIQSVILFSGFSCM